MKYFFVAGEASGDLHASGVMRALKQCDKEASFAYMGGPLMRAEGGDCIIQSEDLAYMGFIDVAKNINKIQQAGKMVQAAISSFQPDVVICVDYAGFCFQYVLPYVRKHLPKSKIAYYIPPKVWAWKKHRIKKLRSHTDLILTIFPFEIPFYKQHQVPQAYYVGNPTLESIERYLSTREKENNPAPYIAIVCGSRKSEIRENLPTMLRVAKLYPDLDIKIAGAPGMDKAFYQQVMAEVGIHVPVVFGQTFSVIEHATAALVTSGTATLETALLDTPQVVCYAQKLGQVANFVFDRFFSVPYISLVNLVAGREVVQELYGGLFKEDKIWSALTPLLSDSYEQIEMKASYSEIRQKLKTPKPAATAASERIFQLAKVNRS